MHEVLFNRFGGLSLPRKSVVRLTDRPYMTLDVYRGRKTTKQLVDSSTVICWTSPFVILGVSGLLSRFYSMFDGI